MAECRGCGKRVFWVFDVDGRSVGLDVKACPDGTLFLDSAGVVERGRNLGLKGRRSMGFREHQCREKAA